MFSWTYFNLKNGRIVDEQGDEANINWPNFKNPDEAEQYLIKNDIRGTMK